jgi:hypothetical protein
MSNDGGLVNNSFPLWSDEPSAQDLLSFDAVAATVVDALFDNNLDPVALGLSGSWGSGKTSVLELVKADLHARSDGAETKILVVPVEPWRFDPTVGPKESLISAVLAAIAEEIKDTEDAPDKAKGMLKTLAKRVNWAKAMKMAALTSVTLQLPKPEDVLGLINEGDNPEEPSDERGLGQFREDFAALLESDELEHVSRVVVLVDDLDRCLPGTVVETLETIRLFLSAKGMSFVIAADEERVADAIAQQLKTPPAAPGEESPASLYLHKIVQTTIPLPGLSRFDTQAYLVLLLTRAEVTAPQFDELVTQCAALRLAGGSIDDLNMPNEPDLTDLLATASRLTPILYEKFKGNPRRIKRFLNDLNVRQAIASRRGISLPSDAVAKLMVLERLLQPDFATVLDWLAANQLRDKLDALEAVANAPATPPEPPVEKPAAKKTTSRKAEAPNSPQVSSDTFSDTLIRWAKLPPALDASSVSGYLYLAASFAGVELIDEGLPERLRDLAAGLTSSLKIDRAAVSGDALESLNLADATMLVTYLGRRTRDQPSLQKYTVEGMLRIAESHPDSRDAVVAAMQALPPREVEPATALKLRALDADTFGPVLKTWSTGDISPELGRTIQVVEESWTGNGN